MIRETLINCLVKMITIIMDILKSMRWLVFYRNYLNCLTVQPMKVCRN